MGHVQGGDAKGSGGAGFVWGGRAARQRGGAWEVLRVLDEALLEYDGCSTGRQKQKGFDNRLVSSQEDGLQVGRKGGGRALAGGLRVKIKRDQKPKGE